MQGDGIRQRVDVAPNHFTDVEFYWHAWALQSPRMEMRFVLRDVY